MNACADEIDWSNFTFQHGFRQPRLRLPELAALGPDQAAAEADDPQPLNPDTAGGPADTNNSSDGPVKMEVDGLSSPPATAKQVCTVLQILKIAACD